MYAFEFTVAHDLGIRIIHLEGSEQGDECCTLCGSPRISSTTFLVQASFIADTDGMGVVMTGMHTYLFLSTRLMELTIAFDVVVIADALVMESGIVAGTKHIDREALVTTCGTTMDHNQVYQTHDCTAMVPKTDVITVAMNLRTFATLVQLIFTIVISYFNSGSSHRRRCRRLRCCLHRRDCHRLQGYRHRWEYHRH